METFLSPCLLLICGPGKVFKENLVYDFPRDQSETGWLSVKHQKNQNSSIYSGFKKILKTKEIKAMQTSFSLKKQHKRTLFHSFRLWNQLFLSRKVTLKKKHIYLYSGSFNMRMQNIILLCKTFNWNTMDLIIIYGQEIFLHTVNTNKGP